MSNKSKIIISLVLLSTLLTGCNSPFGNNETVTDTVSPATTAVNQDTETETASEPIETEPEVIQYEPSAEKWVEGIEDPDKVLLTAEEIEEFNKTVKSRTDTLVDILTFGDSITFEKIEEMINESIEDEFSAYNKDGTEFTNEDYKKVVDNIDYDTLKNDNIICMGVVDTRANLKTIPYDDGLYSEPGDEYDMTQQTALHVGTPLWVLSVSKDGLFLFVQTPFYYGWVSAENVAVTEDRDMWLTFADPEEFIVTISPLVHINGEKIDMGSVLPLHENKGDTYLAIFPDKDDAGMLKLTGYEVGKKDFHLGYMSFTYGALINQAFKYEGTKYGWGGLNDGVDCSSFLKNIFAVFGFELPRDTSKMKTSVGTVKETEGMTHGELSALLDASTEPTLVFYPGHVMLYLGHSDGTYYFIHAPQIGETVGVIEKNDLSLMTYINVIE